jgi:hypothetical protein
MYRSLCVIFMRLGIPKVDEQAIAQILRNVPVKALDDLRTGALVGTHDVPQVFGVESGGEGCRAHYVTEQDRQLAPFCLWSRGRERLRPRRRWRSRRGGGLHGEGRRGRRRLRVARPDEDALVLIPGNLVRIEEFVLEGLQGVVVQAELHFEGPVGHPSPLAQQGDHLIHDRDKVHPGPSLPGAL